MDRTQIIILILVGVLLLAILIPTVILLTRGEEPPEVVIGEFVPPEHDENASVGAPKIPDPSLDYRLLPLVDGYTFGLAGRAMCDGRSARLYFTVSGDSIGNAKVKLYDMDGSLLGESGLIYPGEYVEDIPMTRLPEDPSKVVVRILTYELETYYSLGTASAQIQLVMYD